MDFRREMLREILRELKGDVLDLLFSCLDKGEYVIFSEHMESLSAQDGVERPEESRGSQIQPSSEVPPVSWVMLLWMLELEDRGP